MSVEKAIFARLIKQSGVASKVKERLYPNGQVPADPLYPLLIQEVQSTHRPGILKGRCPTTNYQIKITVWSKTQPEMIALSNAVEDALDNWQDRPSVINCMFQDGFSEPNPDMPEGFSETKVFSIWYADGR